MTTINDIKKHVDSLCEKDAGFAKLFIAERRFYDLKDLVDSSIVIINRKAASLPAIERQKMLFDKSNILKLKEAVDSYLSNIDPDYFDEYEPEGYYEDLQKKTHRL